MFSSYLSVLLFGFFDWRLFPSSANIGFQCLSNSKLRLKTRDRLHCPQFYDIARWYESAISWFSKAKRFQFVQWHLYSLMDKGTKLFPVHCFYYEYWALIPPALWSSTAVQLSGPRLANSELPRVCFQKLQWIRKWKYVAVAQHGLNHPQVMAE